MGGIAQSSFNDRGASVMLRVAAENGAYIHVDIVMEERV
jgi:hypothetical protein